MVDKTKPKSFGEIGREVVAAPFQKNLTEIIDLMDSQSKFAQTEIGNAADKIRNDVYKPLCSTVWEISSGEELMDLLTQYFINESEAYKKAQSTYKKKD